MGRICCSTLFFVKKSTFFCHAQKKAVTLLNDFLKPLFFITYLKMKNDFRNFAVHHLGMNGLALDQYSGDITSNYISPTIMEERQLNVTQMDVF